MLKTYFFNVALLLGISTLGLSQQTGTQNNNTQQTSTKNVVFEEKEYNFGRLTKGVPVAHDFVFQNKEKTPIVILNARAGCHCTTPVWPQKPLMPGEKSQIQVGYDAALEGHFVRTIYVTIEGENMPRELVIKGDVVAEKTPIEIKQ